jgi:hypothetical protein
MPLYIFVLEDARQALLHRAIDDPPISLFASLLKNGEDSSIARRKLALISPCGKEGFGEGRAVWEFDSMFSSVSNPVGG